MTDQHFENGLETEKDVVAFLGLIKYYHRGQMRAGNIHQWQHCYSVAELVAQALSQEEHVDKHTRRKMVLSALGHDLYEDTEIPPEKVTSLYGQHVHDLITSLTNKENDTNVDFYVQRIANASEETRLIKLADLYDNYSSVGKHSAELGWPWIGNVFLPIVEPMYERLKNEPFSRYALAGQHLLKKIQEARETLFKRRQMVQ